MHVQADLTGIQVGYGLTNLVTNQTEIIRCDHILLNKMSAGYVITQLSSSSPKHSCLNAYHAGSK